VSANLFLLVWDYDRLSHVLPFRRHDEDHYVLDKSSKFPAWFFMCVFAAAASVIVINHFLYDIRPGNSQEECTNGCKNRDSQNACRQFCDCIYNQGNPLNACLDEYQKEREAGALEKRQSQ
jgi:hypothetical protein